ncbi:MAG: alpha-xylosidase [Firmicutes bacterium]|nr:alpha-xylosidase [Bacillota bacterium]
MKFSNGCWMQKEGTEVFSPAQVYYTKQEDSQLILCAPTHKIAHRGDTLGGPNLTLRISAPMPEMLRIRCDHYLGVKDKGTGI